MAIENGLAQVSVVTDNDISVVVRIKVVTYKCENWTHS
jgi:hypothetical protein